MMVARHDGGDPDVAPETVVEVLFRSGRRETAPAEDWDWDHRGDEADIIAYRVVDPAQQAATEPGGWRVKPLEWRDGPAASGMSVSTCVFGEYWAWEIGGTGVWSRGSLPGALVTGGLAAARAAAGADYAARIASAIEPAGADVERLREENARLREALTQARQDILDYTRQWGEYEGTTEDAIGFIDAVLTTEGNGNG